jgi:hypothetical protein
VGSFQPTIYRSTGVLGAHSALAFLKKPPLETFV